MEFAAVSNRVIGCAIEVHRALGPGLLESTYEQCLAHELQRTGINFHNTTQKHGIRRFVLCFLRALRVLRGIQTPSVRITAAASVGDIDDSASHPELLALRRFRVVAANGIEEASTGDLPESPKVFVTVHSRSWTRIGITHELTIGVHSVATASCVPLGRRQLQSPLPESTNVL